MEFEAVCDAVRDRVVPGEAEARDLERAILALTERAETAIDELPVDAGTVLVGSTARGTWLAGERDIDLFIRFPPDLSREKLRRYGLQVGHTVVPDGHEEFAEHPYVKGSYDGFDVDCVPCYDVADGSEIRSAVDRTPFHSAYLDGRVDPLADDVRLTKAFLSGIGAYGSTLKTRGFSGFLTELLVVEYGGFRELVEATADWQPPVELDPEGHGRATFDDPLVVIDPTDPERNVAAVCSARNVARLVHYARALLSNPRVELFEPYDPEPLDESAVRKRLDERATTAVAIRFDTPDVVDDQLYPQLDKSLAGVERALDRAGFEPLRSARFADETSVVLVECSVAELPAVVRHGGPPVGVRRHAEGFFDAYRDSDATGPFLDNEGRYVVERPRELRTPEALVDAELFDVSLGPDIERALDSGYELLVGDAVASLADEFGVELARYFEPRP